MTLPPHLQKLIEQEEENRALAWLDVAPDLCGCPIRHLTPRMRNDLLLARNSFFSGRRALLNDVFNFLWRLSPYFTFPVAPEVLLKNRPRKAPLPRFAPMAGLYRLLVLWRAFGSYRTARRFRALERHVARLDLERAEGRILDYLRTILQDRPASNLDESPVASPPSVLPAPRAHWLDDLINTFTESKGWEIDVVLDTSFARLLQLHRAHLISRGARPIDPSHAAISEWIFSEADRLRVGGA